MAVLHGFAAFVTDMILLLFQCLHSTSFYNATVTFGRIESIWRDMGRRSWGILGTSRRLQLWIKDVSSCVNVEFVAGKGRRHNDPRRSRKFVTSLRDVLKCDKL